MSCFRKTFRHHVFFSSFVVAGPYKNFHDLQQVICSLSPNLPYIIPLLASCSQDFEQNLTRELDFTLEASNGEETARQLKHRAPHVYVPKVFKDGQLQECWQV